MTTPLDADELEDLLEDILWAEASSKQASAESLARLDRPQQDFVLRWVRDLEKDNTACAYQFLTHAYRALSELALPDVEAWIIQGLDLYDQSGLYAAVDVFKNVDKFLERARITKVGATLDEHFPVLERVILGLSGRRLRLEAADTIYTDTETLFLPATACQFESREDNFRFLKATATYLWAQTRFGTWQQGVIEAKDCTRMGVAIRHLTEILNQVEAKTRILITLSDGKPDDYSDEYRSEYGIEDRRRALIEAERSDIHPFCITIDKEGQEYLPHMYGALNYTIVDEMEKLPYKVSETYRRLTV